MRPFANRENQVFQNKTMRIRSFASALPVEHHTDEEKKTRVKRKKKNVQEETRVFSQFFAPVW